MGLHLLIVLVCLRVVTFIYPVPIYTKDILNHTCCHPWQPSHLKHEPTNLQRMSTHIHTQICFLPKPWEGLYLPYCPEGWSAKTMRGSLFPLFPLFWWSMPCHLVKTWATKIGEIGTRSCFWHFTKGKHWKGPISPISPKIFPISPILVVHVLTGWIDIGHQNRGNRDPFMVLAFHQGKTLRGPLFPLRVKCQNHERVPISTISPILVVHVLARWKDRPWK